ncbi:hypothetical protein Scep_001311 [Stephania cephalantha]|uniref:Uncharacterized protein n=1 Tax=Stephania cephalantha TaxID=152367 RepID=A0AAP0Q3N6_9MAGN
MTSCDLATLGLVELLNIVVHCFDIYPWNSILIELSEGKRVNGDPWKEWLAEVDNELQLLEQLSNKELLLKNIDYVVELFLIYVLTLSIFPRFLFEDTGLHSLGKRYPLLLVETFNVFDLIGRYIPIVECIKLESRKGIMAASIGRFILIPAIYFTAKYGDQGRMIMLTSFWGLSNGYLTICIFTKAPSGYMVGKCKQW